MPISLVPPHRAQILGRVLQGRTHFVGRRYIAVGKQQGGNPRDMRRGHRGALQVAVAEPGVRRRIERLLYNAVGEAIAVLVPARISPWRNQIELRSVAGVVRPHLIIPDGTDGKAILVGGWVGDG